MSLKNTKISSQPILISCCWQNAAQILSWFRAMCPLHACFGRAGLVICELTCLPVFTLVCACRLVHRHVFQHVPLWLVGHLPSPLDEAIKEILFFLLSGKIATVCLGAEV